MPHGVIIIKGAAHNNKDMANLDFAKGVSVVLTGTANWARLTEASGTDQMSEKYQVDLTLDAASIKTIEGMRVLEHVTQAKYEQPTVRLKTKNLIKVWDKSKTLYTGLIGNGSTLRVRATIKAYEMGGKKGLTVYINEALVLTLESYESAPDAALFEGIDVSQEMPLGAAEVPTNKPDVATAAEAFETTNDDLPF